MKNKAQQRESCPTRLVVLGKSTFLQLHLNITDKREKSVVKNRDSSLAEIHSLGIHCAAVISIIRVG